MCLIVFWIEKKDEGAMMGFGVYMEADQEISGGGVLGAPGEMPRK